MDPEADGSEFAASIPLSQTPPLPQPVAPGTLNWPSTTSEPVVWMMLPLSKRASEPNVPVRAPDVPVVSVRVIGALSVPR